MPIFRPVSSACSRVAYGTEHHAVGLVPAGRREHRGGQAGRPQLLGELVGPGRVLRAADLQVDRRRALAAVGGGQRRGIRQDVALDVPRRAPRDRQPLVGGAVLHAPGLREALGGKVQRQDILAAPDQQGAGRRDGGQIRAPLGRHRSGEPAFADVDHPGAVALGRTDQEPLAEAVAAKRPGGAGQIDGGQLLAAEAVEHQELIVVLGDVEAVPRGGEQHVARVPREVDRARRALALGLVDDDGGVGGHRHEIAVEARRDVLRWQGRGDRGLIGAEHLEHRRLVAHPGEQRAGHRRVQLLGRALQLRAEPDRRPANHLRHRAARVDGVERAVRPHRGRAYLLEIRADPAGLEVEGDEIPLGVEGEDHALLGIGADDAVHRRQLDPRPSTSWDRGTVPGRAARCRPAPGSRSTDDGAGPRVLAGRWSRASLGSSRPHAATSRSRPAPMGNRG